jgi:pimeloyl-ACP methyl ester carboxylesterase
MTGQPAGFHPEDAQMKRATLVIAALILAGIVYEQIGERRDRKRYPQIGRSIDIGGRTLNIYCSGERGPTVIFEGAGHTAGYAWAAMQAEAAKLTRACWYDRAGYGWSDPGPSRRTFKAIANDLHALLRAAATPGPYVLVGAGAGAFHVRVYKGLYPSEVAGAVLIHADDPDVFAHEPESMKGASGGSTALPAARWVQGAATGHAPIGSASVVGESAILKIARSSYLPMPHRSDRQVHSTRRPRKRSMISGCTNCSRAWPRCPRVAI